MTIRTTGWRARVLATPLAAALALALPLAPALLPSSAQAAVAYRLNDPALAARIDGAPLLAFSVDALWRTARQGDAKASRSTALEQAVVNRLLAGSARKTYGEAVLFAGQRVAFAHDVMVDDQLVGMLRGLYGKELEQAMQRLPGASLAGLVTAQPAIAPAALDAVFGRPGQLRLEYTLDAEQLARAQDIVVLRYQLPQGPAGAITLADVYRRQNVQGRVALFSRQSAHLQQQARLALAALYVQHWSTQRFGAAAVADLRRVLDEQDIVQALQQLHGIGNDIDAASPVVKQLVAQVSGAEIENYYRRHREEFRRIEKVKVRHIRLPDERTAQAVAGQLSGGADFGALARRYSSAADSQTGGELGWLQHSGTPDWLAQLAFAQAEGQPSRPIRSPVGPNDKAVWEIVLVDQRVEGYQDPASETVRYVAGNAVAREKAAAQLAALRQRLLGAARIDINRGVLDQPLRILESHS
ncbi:peptidylprolyl isomerase [Rugamonas fusca]|uniref:peptidylprolyl isomerase n=1 Tax=Rugamonas fusca TaxID=2758568 RepID=UPI001E2FFDC3|nr:peptidylprolyl isomerase [Rugamonas fusca]